MEPLSTEDLGRLVVADGSLMTLRNDLGLTLTAMADFLGVSLITYRKWENTPTTRLWARTAERVGRFYRSATAQLQILSEAGVTISEWMPFHEVAELRGQTQEGLLHMHRAGELPHVLDLGVLGLWMAKEVARGR